MSDIIITLPKTVLWEDYQKELDETAKGGTINFKVSNFPKVQRGDKCYITHNGFVKGFMLISALAEKDFTCTTTGKRWKGKFIERSGEFFPINPVPYKGFQGFRYFDHHE
jgi:hypothetical protein